LNHGVSFIVSRSGALQKGGQGAVGRTNWRRGVAPPAVRSSFIDSR
jgi:hypothetical protein